MSTIKIKNLCVATGKYTDRDGNEKTTWLNIGSILQKDDGGKFMLLNRTFNIAGVPNPENRDTIIVSMFDVKNNNEVLNGEDVSNNAPKFNDLPENTDDIPF